MMKLIEPTLDAVRHISVNMREHDRAEIHATRWDNSDETLAVEAMGWPTGIRWVATHNDIPTAFIGAVQLWPGNWSVFMFATDNFRHIGFELTKFVRRSMIPVIYDAGGIRAEARSMSDHKVAHRWLEHLGAERESTLRGYGKNGEDFFVYVWSRRHVHEHTKTARHLRR